MKRIITALCLVASLALTLAGCDKNTFGVVDVTGTLLIDGEPVEGVSVNMSPVDPAANPEQRAAAGVTGADGTFRVITPGSQVAGVMPGEYVLTFQKEVWLTEDGTPADQIPYDPEKPEPKTHPVDLIPAKFKDRDKSECKVTIASGDKTFSVEISTKD